MQVIRVFSGDDGESHLEELDLPYEQVANAEITAMRSATGIQFRRLPVGHFLDFHCAPRRQFVIQLHGQSEIGVSDGTKRIFNPGDVLLAEDVEGIGHTIATVGNVPRVVIFVPLAD